jgi:hypothetical protein
LRSHRPLFDCTTFKQSSIAKHKLDKHRGAVGLSVERKRQKEEDTVQTHTAYCQVGGNAPCSASRL